MGDRQQKAGLDFRMLDREDLRNESKYFADNLLRRTGMQNRLHCKPIYAYIFHVL